MARVLVTGGTGVLGKPLVAGLLGSGHAVRVLSRAAHPTVASGAGAVRGDVRTAEGLADALENIHTVVHAATSPFRRARSTEVEGTRNLVEAAAAARVSHVIYVSIVGVDRIPVPYYRAKWEAERLIEQSDVGWTIQRITQFHDLLDGFFRFGMFARTRNLSFQPIDASDAGQHLAGLVDTGPQGRSADIGGPEVLTVEELCDQRRSITGRRTLLFRVPALGPLRRLDAGCHLASDARHGTTTWKRWLSEKATTR